MGLWAWGIILRTPKGPRATDYWFWFTKRSDEFHPLNRGPKSDRGPSFGLERHFNPLPVSKKVYWVDISQRWVVAYSHFFEVRGGHMTNDFQKLFTFFHVNFPPRSISTLNLEFKPPRNLIGDESRPEAQDSRFGICGGSTPRGRVCRKKGLLGLWGSDRHPCLRTSTKLT